MNGRLRNQQGCWTCRLRKKKCDESRPECSLCASLMITCYGYGLKPEWMDDGPKERAVVNNLKETVKHTGRRKRPEQSSNPIARIAPKSSDESEEQISSSSRSSRKQDTPISSDHGASEDSSLDAPPDPASLIPGSTAAVSSKESALLMRFLDSVFQKQYPIYASRVLEERGWLLSLILKNKAFYHAALALSAHHQRITLPETHNLARAAA